MNDNEDDVNVLDELNKGTCMGRDAIKMILDKVEDEELYKELEKEYNNYKELSDKIVELYPEYDDGEPHETNILNKAMTWYGIEMKTLLDDTSSKLAELIYINNPTSIFIDKSKNKQKEIEDFNRKFTHNLNNFKKYPISIRHVNSKNYPGLQVADVISWSVFQSLENKNSEFIDLIENIYMKEL